MFAVISYGRCWTTSSGRSVTASALGSCMSILPPSAGRLKTAAPGTRRVRCRTAWHRWPDPALTTETGAGQWGSALAMACPLRVFLAEGDGIRVRKKAESRKRYAEGRKRRRAPGRWAAPLIVGGGVNVPHGPVAADLL